MNPVTKTSKTNNSEPLTKLKEVAPGVVGTVNQTGFMHTELSAISTKYLEFASTCECVLEIGCAYGITVLPLLNNKKTRVFAVDLAAEHLDFISNSINDEQKNYFNPYVSNFPLETDFFEPGIFEAIHISNVLHFIEGKNFRSALQKCFNWLTPNGKLYINTCSIYLPFLKNFVAVYENRKNYGYKWPGEIYNYNDFAPAFYPAKARECQPSFVHVFKKEDLEKIIIQEGFNIEGSFYFTLKNLKLIKYTDDSKSFIGIIANKK
jgi:2-polyprenyl-3-methyl-5-hydroxy-6-metoxy-1,4-benzoquinol methylase